jgi:hypothetical protein
LLEAEKQLLTLRNDKSYSMRPINLFTFTLNCSGKTRIGLLFLWQLANAAA